MKTNKIIKALLLASFSLVSVTSCIKDDNWSTPGIDCHNRFDSPTITMAQFVALAPAAPNNTTYNGASTYKVPSDGEPIIFDAYVVSSDENGNFYKSISFQDSPENPTVGLSLEIDRASNYADFPVGSHIRIKANGLVLGLDRGTIKLGSIDPTYAIGRIPGILLPKYMSGVCNGNGMNIVELVPTKLASLKEAKSSKYINMLVSVDDVQFSDDVVLPDPLTYNNYIAGVGQDTDRAIEDKTNATTNIRNSGYFTFGSTLLPKTSGTLNFVVSRYNANFQMLIRSLNDVKFTNARIAKTDLAPPLGGTDISYLGNFIENFESYPVDTKAFPKYVNDPFIGERYWELKSFKNNKYIQMSANRGTGDFNTYFIVPIDFTNANSLTFKVNVGYYNGNALKIYTTDNYTIGGEISESILTDISSSFTIPKTPTNGYGNFTSAGTHSFPPLLTGNGFVIFKYEGAGNGTTTTIQIDDITVK